MIEASDFITPARDRGFDFWAGVPCSFLTAFINAVIEDEGMHYISSANEGDAVAAASGAVLGGTKGVVMMQNSGLGNAVSPLSSLNWVFGIPVLLIITLRGEPGLQDEPQHELMGQITGKLLDTLKIPWDWFPRAASDVEGALTVAEWHMEKSGLPYAFIMRKGSVAPLDLSGQWTAESHCRVKEIPRATASEPLLGRCDALRAVIEATPEHEAVVIATTGYTGRELFSIADRSNHLYMVGSMGCASSLALGLSLVVPDKRVLVVDGDGSALMRMGNIATAGAYGGENFHHLILDNGVHESTGGQATVSAAVSFAGVARSCGYRQADSASTPAELDDFLQGAEGPSMLHLKIRRGVSEDLPRPNVSPRQVRSRLMTHLGVQPGWGRG